MQSDYFNHENRQRLKEVARKTGIASDIIQRYFAHRKPCVSKYFRGVVVAPANGSFACAKRESAIESQWARLEDLNMVRMRFAPDEDFSYDDMCGDMFNVEHKASSVHGGARTIIAQEKAYKAMLERDGVWGCIGEFTLDDCDGNSRCKEPDTYGRRARQCDCGATWHHGASLWALEGTDDYGYQTDIKSETIDALKSALRARPVITAPSRLRKATVQS